MNVMSASECKSKTPIAMSCGAVHSGPHHLQSLAAQRHQFEHFHRPVQHIDKRHCLIINILENDFRMARLITNQDDTKSKLPTAKYSSELLKNQHLIQVAVKQLDEFIFQRAAKLQLSTAVQQAKVTHPVQTRIPEVRFVNKWGATGELVIFKTNENIVTWLEKFHGKVTDYFHPSHQADIS